MTAQPTPATRPADRRVPDAGLRAPLQPGQPQADGEPVFRAPWEAQAFAMTVALHARGLFTWPDWTAALAEQIRAAQQAGDADDGRTYYHHWLAALETLLARVGVGTPADLERHAEAWRRAAARTPHGEPIVPEPRDHAAAVEAPGVATRLAPDAPPAPPVTAPRRSGR